MQYWGMTLRVSPITDGVDDYLSFRKLLRYNSGRTRGKWSRMKEIKE